MGFVAVPPKLENKLWALLVLALFCFTFVGECWAHRVEVQILGYAEVPANQSVKMGLIAQPGVDETSKFESIENLEVLPARPAGDRRFLGRVEMARALQEALGGSDFSFKIPNQMIIESRANFISRFDLNKALKFEALKQCPDCELKIRDVRIPELKDLGGDLLSWSIDASQTKLLGSFLVPIRVQTGSGEKNFFASGTIDAFKQGYVTRKAIPAGERLTESDLEMKIVNVTYLKGSLLQAQDLKGQLLAKYVVAGQPLLSGDIKKEPAAVRGQLMKVIAGDETLEINTQAIAEEPGFVGDLIKLKNTETQKLISGKIIDKGLVKLQ